MKRCGKVWIQEEEGDDKGNEDKKERQEKEKEWLRKTQDEATCRILRRWNDMQRIRKEMAVAPIRTRNPETRLSFIDLIASSTERIPNEAQVFPFQWVLKEYPASAVATISSISSHSQYILFQSLNH